MPVPCQAIMQRATRKRLRHARGQLRARFFPVCGAVAEWSKALAWKVSIRQNRIEGSNPSRSATPPGKDRALAPGRSRASRCALLGSPATTYQAGSNVPVSAVASPEAPSRSPTRLRRSGAKLAGSLLPRSRTIRERGGTSLDRRTAPCSGNSDGSPACWAWARTGRIGPNQRVHCGAAIRAHQGRSQRRRDGSSGVPIRSGSGRRASEQRHGRRAACR